MADMHHSDKSMIAVKFHNTVAQAILEVSELMRKETSIEKVVLSGGVFQNKYLLEKTITNTDKKDVQSLHKSPGARQ